MSIVLICGPSGVGKSFLTKKMVNTGYFEKIVGITTREKRSYEIEGTDSYFVGEEEYQRRLGIGEFISDSYHLGAYYGVSFDELQRIFINDRIPIMEYHAPLIPTIKQYYPDLYSIYMYPHSLDLIKIRMHQRGDDEAKIKYRMGMAEIELQDVFSNHTQNFSKFFMVDSDDTTNIEHSIYERFGLHFDPEIHHPHLMNLS
jgi:guanylate kinase